MLQAGPDLLWNQPSLTTTPGVQGGAIFCNARTPLLLNSTQLLRNSATSGGAVFAHSNCT